MAWIVRAILVCIALVISVFVVKGHLKHSKEMRLRRGWEAMRRDHIISGITGGRYEPNPEQMECVENMIAAEVVMGFLSETPPWLEKWRIPN